LKHYSIRAGQAKTQWIKRYILHFGKKHPRDIGAAEVEQQVASMKHSGARLIETITYDTTKGNMKGGIRHQAICHKRNFEVVFHLMLEAFSITIITGINTSSYTKGDTR